MQMTRRLLHMNKFHPTEWIKIEEIRIFANPFSKRFRTHGIYANDTPAATYEQVSSNRVDQNFKKFVFSLILFETKRNL